MSHTIRGLVVSKMEKRKKRKRKIDKPGLYKKEFCYDFLKISFILKELVYNLVLSY